MVDIMTPSQLITAGQIGNIQEILGAGLRKSGLASEPVQQVLEHQGDELINELIAVVRSRVKAVSDMIVRHVKVNRDRSPQETLEATGRRLYVTESVVATMPRGDGEEIEVVFFKVGRFVSDDDGEKEYELRGLKPADPYSVAAVNEDDQAFTDDHPNCIHW